ncbi:MAG: helix-turn-helix domain-containing protein [Cyclobacteriaceae bacterium]|nr:helix-turn-helix domain-containing protein [Cyclobacteriaceae bacterium]
MTDLSYDSKWNGMSDGALERSVGGFVRYHRLNQNKSQQEVANAAMISRSTLSLLERGQTVTLSTLIRVLRVLDLLYIMEIFEIRPQISPMELARQEQDRRKRAGRKKEGDTTQTDWS